MVTHRQWTRADHDVLMKRVLAALTAPDHPPISTSGIRQRFVDLDAYERENYVRRELNLLVEAGWVERIPVDGETRAFWRLTSQGEEGRRRGTLPAAD